MLSTLTSIFLWAVFGAIMGWWLGAATGFACLAFGLLIMVLVSGAHVSRIQKWTRNLNDPPPPSIGPWDAILAPVYRQLRRDRHEILDLNRHVDGIMMAAEALPDGAITLNADMELQWCNQTACEHIGLNLATDRHHSIFNILRAPEFSRYARQSRWDGPLLLHIDKDGLEKSLLLQLTPYGLGQFLIVTRDVTQVEKLETTRKDFVANVSHELRTPLTVLLGFLETLRDMPPESLTPEQRQRYETMMLEQTRHMQSIVADLLTLSTLESSPTVEGETVQVSNLIQSALKQGEALSGGQHIFVTNLDPNLAIQGMENELSSAVSNLITNAIRYTPKDGTITVSWYMLDNGDACYSVQDTGIGIAPQDIPRLTERFYRVDKGRSRSTGGTGLGLAITKHIVVRHNAELQIQSRLGVGSIFTLRFPKSRVRILDS
ncbi:phosphate regulon sensor histidine kinase PhoR [Alcaligenes sp. WGS1538]|uniref:phosphate regulon sensor histidine kinase PhoR n=1 Tax=Alcaligenes sp. WGS1538 TaxID=3366811 RepID=UPI00372D1888